MSLPPQSGLANIWTSGMPLLSLSADSCAEVVDMKVTDKLKAYFGAPSSELQKLIDEVAELERGVEASIADEDQRVGRMVRHLDEGWGIARGVDTFYLVEGCAGKICRAGDSPLDVLS